MPEPKAQLVDPQGPIDVPGINATGIVTATGGFTGNVQGAATGFAATTYNLNVGIVTGTKFQGNTTGNVSGLADDTNINVGIITSTSFTGDLVGNAAGLSTTTANIKAGIMTATSFAGNFTGLASGITGTPNVVAGIVTATQFIGNTPGLAAGISAGKNLAAGIVTATTFHGDGSALTGAGSTAYIRQTVGSGTTIDLNNGNIILFEHVGDTTVSFANTSTADDVTFIRPLTDPTAISISTGGVTFDGTGDYLSMANSADFDFGSGDFTIEAFIYHTSDAGSGANAHAIASKWNNQNNDKGWYFRIEDSSGDKLSFLWTNDGSTNEEVLGSTIISLNKWYHTAVTRSGNTIRLFLDGVLENTYTETGSLVTATIEQLVGAAYNAGSIDNEFAGNISNVRIIKGRALYTTGFYPPSAELTNVADTKLLCCQSDSSTTVGAVKPGTITAGGDPAAGAQTITLNPTLGSAITWPSGITWNGGSAPTLASANSYSKTGQVFNLVTADGGTTWYGYEEVNNTSLEPFGMFVTGNNSHGMLGQNSEVDYSSPVQIPGTWNAVSNQLGPVTTTIQIQRKSDGTLWGWGQNQYGSLGHNNRTNYSSPVQIPGTTWAVGASNEQCLWTKTDGTLWVWGRNDTYGQLGLNNRTEYSSPVQVGSGTDWCTSHDDGIKLTTSKQYQASGAIKTDGTLWVWGQNDQGQLGKGNIAPYSSPTQIPGTNWKSVSCVWSSMMALKTNGELWAWGMGYNGVLAQNNRSIYSSPRQIPGTTWASIAGGDQCAYATKTDGTLWSWGYNTVGQLGNNSNETGYSSPVQIPGTTWNTAALGGGGGLPKVVAFTKTDGTLWSWGNNTAGTLGHNQPENSQYSSPVQVPGTNWKRVTTSGENNVWFRST